VRRAIYLAGVAALLVAGTLALSSALFATSHALDPVFSAELRLSLWLHDAGSWTVGAVLFVLAAARLGGRPMDAWVAAILAAVVITVASFNANTVPASLRLAATIACALAPWIAIAFPPSSARALLAAANLTLIVAAPLIAAATVLPWWLRSLAPIDPLTIPAWLASRPLQWPWIVVAAPVLFDVTPHDCCVAIPAHTPLLVVLPAAIAGFVIWYRGRRRPEAPPAWHGPAGVATRRG
jgi:hypothetical protein